MLTVVDPADLLMIASKTTAEYGCRKLSQLECVEMDTRQSSAVGIARGTDRLGRADGDYLRCFADMKPDLTVWLGKMVCVQVDRPIHSHHPDRPSLQYELNYGFVPNTVSGDLEPIDAYILGIEQPLESFKGIVIAVLVRADDVEDKLVVASPSAQFSDTEIMRRVSFKEKYFQSLVVRRSN